MLLEQLTGPDQQAFDKVFDLAVADNPYGSKDNDGRYHCKAGATHLTPQELVAAYLRNHGLVTINP